jgi:hypothetical protein
MSKKYTLDSAYEGGHTVAYVKDPDGNRVGGRMNMDGVTWDLQVRMANDAYERGKRDAAAPVVGGKFNVGDWITWPSGGDYKIVKMTSEKPGREYADVEDDRGHLYPNQSIAMTTVKKPAARPLTAANVTNPGWTA